MDSALDTLKTIGTMLLVLGLSIAFGLYWEWAAKGDEDDSLPQSRLSHQA